MSQADPAAGPTADPAPGAAPGAEGRQRSPKRGMCAAVLFLEGIVIALSTPVMIAIENVSTGTALAVGLGLAAACILVAGMLRAEWAYTVGWLIQVAAIALGFLVSAMFFLGILFGGLWALAVWLGVKIDRERAAAWARYRMES